ncbi:hypothetical protein GGR70_001413 [Xanthomonas campestris]|nr:hypothetical protein [Xanthomonas campestris]
MNFRSAFGGELNLRQPRNVFFIQFRDRSYTFPAWQTFSNAYLGRYLA